MGRSGSSDFVEAVRQATDIVRLVSDYVPLKKSGSRLAGLCPFHKEKTPSFSVDPVRGFFYCFGCQTGGDAFKFVQLYEKLEFMEAVEFLARRFGVAIPDRRRGRRPDAAGRLIEMNRAAEAFYRSRLRDPAAGRKAREYLARRGIEEATAEELSLGYAPDGWEALRDHLSANRFSAEEMRTGGLVLDRKSGSGQYDRFRDRLIFPIRDVSGRTLAFGGRALGDQDPKYLNSPETPAYVKGRHLYGLDLAAAEIRTEGFVVIVEGYMDAAALRQAGFRNVVASLGTAFTPDQARLLARFTDRVAVSYDGDAAGAKATIRSLDLLLERGFRVRVVDLPAGMDPDDFLRKEGTEAYAARVRQAPEYLEYLVAREARSRDLSRVEEKIAAVNAVLPHLARLDNAIERASWAGRLADALGIEDELVLQQLRRALRGAGTRIRTRAPEGSLPPAVETRLVELLLSLDDPAETADLTIDEADLEGTGVGVIVRSILRLFERGGPVNYETVYNELDEEDHRTLLTRIAFEPQAEDGASLESCLAALRERRLEREKRRLVRKIEGAGPNADEADLRRLQELARERDALAATTWAIPSEER